MAKQNRGDRIGSSGFSEIRKTVDELGRYAVDKAIEAESTGSLKDAQHSIELLTQKIAALEAKLQASDAHAKTLADDLKKANDNAASLQQSWEGSKQQVADLQRDYDNLSKGLGVDALEKQLDKFKSNAEQAVYEVRAWLQSVNLGGLETDDHYASWADDQTNAQKVTAQLDAVREGSQTAQEAIGNLKVQFQDLFRTGSDSGFFDQQQVASFTAILDAVRAGIVDVQASLEAVRQEGVKSISTEGSETNAISAVNNLVMQLGESSGDAADRITKLLAELNSFASVDDAKIASISQSFRNIAAVGSGSMSESYVARMTLLANNLKTLAAGDGGRFNIDFSGLEALNGFSLHKAPVDNLERLSSVIGSFDVAKLNQLAGVNLSNLSSLKVGKNTYETIQNLVETLRLLPNYTGGGRTRKSVSSIEDLYLKLSGQDKNSQPTKDQAVARLGEALDEFKAGKISYNELAKAAAQAERAVKAEVNAEKEAARERKRAAAEADRLAKAENKRAEQASRKAEAEATATRKQYESNISRLLGNGSIESYEKMMKSRINTAAAPKLEKDAARSALANVVDLLGKNVGGDIAAMKELNNSIREFELIMGRLSRGSAATNAFEKQQRSIEQLRGKIDAYMKSYGDMATRSPELYERFQDLLGRASTSDGSNARELSAEFERLVSLAKSLGVEAETTSKRMNNLFSRHFSTGIVVHALMALRTALRQLWQDIRDVNDALVQTQVVTGLTGAALEKYTDKAYAAAARSRDTITNILNSATAYGRLGYDSDISVQLAELTSMYAKLGDTDVSSATDAITALMKAFDLENADEIEAALDKMIYVGNNFPISAAGLGEGLNNAASALKASGNTLEESMALIMAANTTVQNPAKASTAMRTITARIRNTTAELDELGESLDEEYNTVAKYRARLKSLSKGVDILGDDGNFRSTYAILQDLAKVWETLDSQAQAAITTMLAGTRMTDIFSSLMQNFPSAEEAVAGMDDAVGLMDQKFTAVEGSITGSLNELSNAWSRFSTTLADTGTITNAIKALTGLVNLLTSATNQLGGGGTIAVAGVIMSLVNGMRQFNQTYPGMLTAAQNLNNAFMTSGIDGAAQSLRDYNVFQQRYIILSSQMSGKDQEALMTSMGLSSAHGMLASSITMAATALDNLKMRMQAFVQSGNAVITIVMLIVQVIMTVVNLFQQGNEEARRAAEIAHQNSLSSMKSLASTIESLDNSGKSIEAYKSQLESLKDTIADTDSIKKADSIVADLTAQFGIQAKMVLRTSYAIDQYISNLDKLLLTDKYKKLFDIEDDSFNATKDALSLFGIDTKGKSIRPDVVSGGASGSLSIQVPTSLSGQYADVANTMRIDKAITDRVDEILGDTTKYLRIWTGPPSKTRNKDGYDVSLGAKIFIIDGASVAEVISGLDKQFVALKETGDEAGASFLSSIRSAIVAATGYSDALKIYKEFVQYRLLYESFDNDSVGTNIQRQYQQIVSIQKQFDEAVANGDIDVARMLRQEILTVTRFLIMYAEDSGADWALEFLRGMEETFQSGSSATIDAMSPSGDTPVAFTPGNHASTAFSSQYSAVGQDTATSAVGNVGSLDEAVENYLHAKELFEKSVQRDEDGSIVNVDASEKDLDEINDYLGTNFEELTEENADAFATMFSSIGEDIYGTIDKSVTDAFAFAQENIDGFNLSDYITDEGIDFSGLLTAFASLPASADQAGAAASIALAQKLRDVVGMQFALKEENGGITVTSSGGVDPGTTTKPSGGGGGRSSKISKAYQADIDALERIIEMWKQLLNYYEEGSDQWIARQLSIIDKYKAGVEIAQEEYNRLLAKGVKQTDEDVQTLAEAILEYQDNIFEESENLWKAVRQNQIDALQLTKDQNDAAIKLEESHHDLLKSIRDERRELEAELKAARDAYSEVMTPQELDALFSGEDFAELMGKLADIESEALDMYSDYQSQIAAVSEDESYLIEHITDEFERQYELKLKEYEVAKAELGVARAQQELENARNEQTVMMLRDGMWQWVADPEKVLTAEEKLADAQQELADAQDEASFRNLIASMESQSSEIQRQIDALEALKFSMDELAEQIHLFSDTVYKDLLKLISSSAQSSFAKYDGDTAVPQFHTGGVTNKGGLARLHDNEVIFNSADAAKLWKFVHNGFIDTPINTDSVMSAIARLIMAKPGEFGASQTPTVIDNSVKVGEIVVNGEQAQQLINLLRGLVATYQP